MQNQYLLVSYIEYAGRAVKSTDTILYSTQKKIDTSEIKDFIRSEVLKNDEAVITFASIQNIDEETYFTLSRKQGH